jgi:hypothetical protein
MVLTAAPGRTDPLQNEAILQSTNVWNNLGLPAAFSFNPVSEELAYNQLALTVPAADFNRLGNFLHLVKQSVLVNAAGYGLNLPTAQLFNALSTGFNTAAAVAVLSSANNPIDPNSLAGPVKRSTSYTHARSSLYTWPSTSLQALSLFGGGLGAELAATPFAYTINFENVGPGVTPSLTVSINIDPTLKASGTFALSEITWGQNKLYPDGFAPTGTGPFNPVAPGALAPIPPPGAALFYHFPSGALMILTRDNTGTTFTWTFWKGWLLANQESGSVSFLIEPIGAPSATDASSVPAQTSFVGDPTSPHFTNPWTIASF